jgi:uncharacterized protein (DUF1330 family)
MTLRWKFAVVALVSLVIGAVGARLLLAQSPPRGYVIAEIEVTDPDTYKTYLAKVTPVVQSYGGYYIVRGLKTESLEGAKAPSRLAILEFPSFAQAQKWYTSAEYREVAPIRQRASNSRLYLVEGVTPTTPGAKP